MPCRGEVPFLSRSEILAEAAKDLAPVLDAAAQTVVAPDYWGSEWIEVYSGNPLLPQYVMVDYVGNVFHVQRSGETFAADRFAITYLPSWLVHVLNGNRAGFALRIRAAGEAIAVHCSDRDVATALRIEVAVRRPTDTRIALYDPATGAPPGARSRTAVLPQVVYDMRPSRGAFVLREGMDPREVAVGASVAEQSHGDAPAQSEAIERAHWTAPALRIVAAPGVSVVPRELFPVIDSEFDPWAIDLSGGVAALKSSPFWGWFVMNAAYCADDAAQSHLAMPSTSQQMLALEIERVQNAEALPPPGAPWRVGGTSELDLVGADEPRGMRIEEETLPDGVDLLLLPPLAADALARAQADPLRAMADSVAWAGTRASGSLAPDTAVPMRIRVDPQSADDRFACSVTYLNAGKPVAAPWLAGRTGPFFRVSVVRTAGVRVEAALLFGANAAEVLASIMEFRERVVSFDDIPRAIIDHGAEMPQVPVRARALTAEEWFDLTMLAIGMVPFPPCQVIADLNDYASLLRYLCDGKDTMGREMSGWEAAATFAGLMLPEVLEPAVKHAARLATAADGPARRILDAFAEVSPLKLASVSVPQELVK